MAGAADRCVIPEHPFEMEQLAELLTYDRNRNPSNYSVVIVSEGATFPGDDDHSYDDHEKDQYGHKKLGGVGDRVAAALKALSPKHNGGRPVNVVSQRLGYIVRCGDPDALDSIVPMAIGNLALDLILKKKTGRLVTVEKGLYSNAPIEVVTGSKKIVNVAEYYNTERLRPKYDTLAGQPLFIMTGG
jgi:6-phosphofructokinase 1